MLVSVRSCVCVWAHACVCVWMLASRSSCFPTLICCLSLAPALSLTPCTQVWDRQVKWTALFLEVQTSLSTAVPLFNTWLRSWGLGCRSDCSVNSSPCSRDQDCRSRSFCKGQQTIRFYFIPLHLIPVVCRGQLHRFCSLLQIFFTHRVTTCACGGGVIYRRWTSNYVRLAELIKGSMTYLIML